MRQFMRVFFIFITILLLLAVSGKSYAGQVVTAEVQAWAKGVLQQEQALKTEGGRNTLAVLYFVNATQKTELDPLQKGLTLMLVTDLTNVKGLQVVERVRLQALMDEMRLQTSGLVDAGTRSRVGKLMGAKWLVGGQIGADSRSYLDITSHLLDVPSTEVLGNPRTEGKLEELFTMEKDLLFSLVKLLKIEVTPEEEARMKKPCSTSIDAAISLFKGIEASDMRDYAAADAYYKKALEEDPNVCVAREAMEELKALGLVRERKPSGSFIRGLREDTSLTNSLSAKEGMDRERLPKDIGTTTPADITITIPGPADLPQ